MPQRSPQTAPLCWWPEPASSSIPRAPPPESARCGRRFRRRDAMDESSNPPADRFSLSPRQRRLRVITLLILVGVILMIVVGLTHPFFRPVRPAVLTPRIARALKVKILIIGLSWISCSLL